MMLDTAVTASTLQPVGASAPNPLHLHLQPPAALQQSLDRWVACQRESSIRALHHHDGTSCYALACLCLLRRHAGRDAALPLPLGRLVMAWIVCVCQADLLLEIILFDASLRPCLHMPAGRTC